jgi:hypothetical protein
MHQVINIYLILHLHSFVLIRIIRYTLILIHTTFVSIYTTHFSLLSLEHHFVRSRSQTLTFVFTAYTRVSFHLHSFRLFARHTLRSYIRFAYTHFVYYSHLLSSFAHTSLCSLQTYSARFIIYRSYLWYSLSIITLAGFASLAYTSLCSLRLLCSTAYHSRNTTLLRNVSFSLALHLSRI